VNIVELLILTLVFVALVAGHFFPWHWLPVLVNERGNLKRVLAYSYGSTCVLLGMAAYEFSLLPTSQTEALIKLYLFAAMGTIAPRILLRFREMGWALEEQDESTNKGRSQ